LIKVPRLDDQSIATYGILGFNSEQEKKQREALAVERQKHRGYPLLNTKGKLDPLVCNYPECGKRFSCRDHLFRHLKSVIPPERMFKGHHQKHWKIQANRQPFEPVCEACGEKFETMEAVLAHYGELGVRGFKTRRKSSPDKVEDKEQDKPIDPYNNPDECVICMEANRAVVNIPCGHMCSCEDCAALTKTCPICRVPIQDVLKVFYS